MFVARFSQAKHVYVVVAGRLKVIRDDVSAAATDGLPGAYAVLVFLAHHVFDYTGGAPSPPGIWHRFSQEESKCPACVSALKRRSS